MNFIFISMPKIFMNIQTLTCYSLRNYLSVGVDICIIYYGQYVKLTTL